jgi:hypothetical protein
MGIKERVKNLEMRVGKLPQAEMEKVMDIFGRAMVQFGGAGVIPAMNNEPVTDEEYEFLINRLNRLKDT